MSGWERVKVELDKPLDPRHVKGRKQGNTELDYIEGWWAIAEANEIFGNGSWSRETVDLIQLGEPYQRDKLDWRTKKPTGEKLWVVNYRAKSRVTVDMGIGSPVVRDGSGFGSGIDADLGRAHESALKEAETDSFKRAISTFGWRFGLALYQKREEREHVSSVEEGEGQGVGSLPPSDPPQWDEVPPQLDNRITPQDYKNGGTDPSSANSGRSLAILKEAMKKQATPTALTRWCKAHKDAIGALTANDRWNFFSEIVHRGIDMCNSGTDLDVFWTSNEKGLNSIKKGDPLLFRDLENYYAEKFGKLAGEATGGPAELTFLDAGE